MRQRWIQINGKLVPEAEADAERAKHSNPKRTGITVIPDISEPFVSPVDGSTLSSRADVREHNIRNGVVDVGNDPAYKNPKKPSSTHESAASMIHGILNGDIPDQERLGRSSTWNQNGLTYFPRSNLM